MPLSPQFTLPIEMAERSRLLAGRPQMSLRPAGPHRRRPITTDVLMSLSRLFEAPPQLNAPRALSMESCRYPLGAPTGLIDLMADQT